ncbi:histone deacetylase family protein [Pseudoalteromonas xiamenensis]|uniref:Histone deacetylase family protein n=1 Tax=Pseudoalteromonas xiamenensis TaxID=882626 RepID=A0A975HLV3_9GAMM|nr:histone deacetylase family protein [Pseudoalteromonas xiamenensis]QTH72491.1 histone deacetylase family protein [Pseudoalteromonas xiamenensis]
MRTAIITHPLCRRHKMIADHPECPERLDAISDRILASGLDLSLLHKTAPKCSMEDITSVHSKAMVEQVINTLPTEGLASLDGDTWLCPDSFKAIERAVGAGIMAVDGVLAGEFDAAFCSVRPPGHHANQTSSSGFCVFNNLAIAVKHAQQLGVNRIAILDIDVHHGNGTQDIFHDDENVLFCSLFQYPFYPNTPIENNEHIVNSPMKINSNGADLKQVVTNDWLPRLREFRAELIFISAGFDAHLEDDMASLAFVEADYSWFSEVIAKLAKEFGCKGIISFLEGGYELSSLGRSVAAHLRALVECE